MVRRTKQTSERIDAHNDKLDNTLKKYLDMRRERCKTNSFTFRAYEVFNQKSMDFKRNTYKSNTNDSRYMSLYIKSIVGCIYHNTYIITIMSTNGSNRYKVEVIDNDN